MPPNRFARFRWPWLLAVWRFCRRTTNPVLRAIHRLEAGRSDVLLQPFPDTWPDRHPALFAYVRDALKDVDHPQLLSFGCSTGEEPVTLAGYLPHARIDAIDINSHSLTTARKMAARLGIGSIAFALADRPPEQTESYDAVFCLSVLRHGRLEAERPDNCSAILAFSRFDTLISQLDHCLKPGGLMIIWGSQFEFAAAAVAAGYEAQMVPDEPFHAGPIYGPDDRLKSLNGQQACVFRKL